MHLPNGHLKLFFEAANAHVQDLVRLEQWERLDEVARHWLQPLGPLHELLKKYCDFQHVEHILALRQDPDEDGIWHDDGSRSMAFSLSLNLDAQKIGGGELQLRHKEDLQQFVFPCQPWGTLLLFSTGKAGYEHRVTRVTTGKRLVMAGWCS